MRIAYLVADWKKPVAGPLGPAVHIQEMCAALARRGHEVFLVAADPGTPEDAARSAVPVHVIAPPWQGVAARAAGVLARLRPRRGRRGRSGPAAAGGDAGGGAGGGAGFGAPRWRLGVLAADALRFTAERLWFRYFHRRARRLLRELRPDAIYERYDRGGDVGVRLARELGLPLMLEMNQSLTFREQWRNPHTPLYVRWARRAERAVCLAADRVAIVSPSLEPYLTSLGVPPEKVTLVPCAAEPERYRGIGAAASRVRATRGLGNGPVVGFVGSFRPWFDLELLLDAFARVRGAHPAARLLLVGDGEQRAALEARAQAADLAGSVIFTGYVSSGEVPAYIGAMDVAVVTYRRLPDFDFLPLKVFEYMAAARPVIASATPAMRSVVEDGRNGLLAPQEDAPALAAALSRLLGDEALRRRLGGAALATIEARFTWERHAQRVEATLAAARAAGAPAGRVSAPAPTASRGPGARY